MTDIIQYETASIAVTSQVYCQNIIYSYCKQTIVTACMDCDVIHLHYTCTLYTINYSYKELVIKKKRTLLGSKMISEMGVYFKDRCGNF